MAAAKTRRPTITAVRNAADVLARALRAEAEHVRAERGHNGHVLAQELSYAESRVRGYANQIESLRRNRS